MQGALGKMSSVAEEINKAFTEKVSNSHVQYKPSHCWEAMLHIYITVTRRGRQANLILHPWLRKGPTRSKVFCQDTTCTYTQSTHKHTYCNTHYMYYMYMYMYMCLQTYREAGAFGEAPPPVRLTPDIDRHSMASVVILPATAQATPTRLGHMMSCTSHWRGSGHAYQRRVLGERPQFMYLRTSMKTSHVRPSSRSRLRVATRVPDQTQHSGEVGQNCIWQLVG